MKLIGFLTLLLLMHPVLAANNNIIDSSIDLTAIKAIKTTEKHGDELYFDVLVYSSNSKPKHYRIPNHPFHWPSEITHKLSDLNLWQGKIKPNEAVTLIISLIEMDSPPWNTDDLIGSIRVRLKNDNGKLVTSWGMPNRVDPPTAVIGRNGRVEKFQLLGDNSNYELFLRLK
jgi:hypothetical protein